MLAEGIALFFLRRDPLAVHTVISAAHQALSDLGRKRGYGGVFRDERIIRAEHRDEFRKRIKEAENFLKHADSDPDGELTFTPSLTQAFILDATELHVLLTREILWECAVFRAWFSSHSPEVLLPHVKEALASLLPDLPPASEFQLYSGVLEEPRGERLPVLVQDG